MTLNVQAIVAPMQAIHDSGINQTYAWRYEQLDRLDRMVAENVSAIQDALYNDLHKDHLDATAFEISLVQSEIRLAKSQLKHWMAPVQVASPALCLPAFSKIEPRPLRSPACLIIGPFNYPFNLVMIPLVGCLAAGNPAVLKPSELVQHTSALFARLIPHYFEPGAVQVVLGGIPETTALLQQHWGLIYFTGSPRVGKIVARAAAETLTPTALELGGKCPCLVDETCPADIRQVANRIVWAKLVNAGQTCCAIDYLLVHESILPKLLVELKRAIVNQYTSDPKTLSEMTRIVSSQHAERLVRMIQEVETMLIAGNSNSSSSSTKILHGSSEDCDPSNQYVCPTMVLNPPSNCALLKEETFGPILSIIPVTSRQQAIDTIRTLSGSHPLCVYVFTTSEQVFDQVIRACPSGSAVRNDAILHFSSSTLPIGGLGTSGLGGGSHGKFTFDQFSHALAVMYRPCAPGMDLNMLRFHPFGNNPNSLKTKLVLLALRLPYVPVLHCRAWLVAFALVSMALVVMSVIGPKNNEAVFAMVARVLEGMAMRIREAGSK